MSEDLVSIIFGLKVRQARLDAGLTLSDFAARCDISPSYVTEIEKGRRYPRVDKITRMAEVLGKAYDEMVSVKLGPSLTYLESTLSSAVLHRFPFEEFGFELSELVHLLTRDPDKGSALLHAVLEIARHYDLREPEFLRAALRSYQEIHDNYFPELEEAVTKMRAEFGQKHDLDEDIPVRQEAMERILHEEFGYDIDYETIVPDSPLAVYRNVFVQSRKPLLLVNSSLRPRQIKFLLARQLGYQYLRLKEGSHTSPPEEIESFQQILNDLKASYFGGALLMPRDRMVDDMNAFFRMSAWNPQPLYEMLARYDVTPEMLMHRFSELIPETLGLKLHFLRFQRLGESYELISQLNMNHLPLPRGLGLREHYCRRWLGVRMLRDMRMPPRSKGALDHPRVGVQVSEFFQTDDRFLCIALAGPLILAPHIATSVEIGFRFDNALHRAVQFLYDPDIPIIITSSTCERCPMTHDQCRLRATEAVLLHEQEERTARKLLVNQLKSQLRR